MTDLSRSQGNHKKRDISVSAFRLKSSDIPGADTYELGVLPTNILIVGSSVTNVVAFSAATAISVEMVGGATLITTADLAAAADTVVDSTSTPLATQTGPVVTATLTGGVALTAGEAVVTVEYIELDQCTGELTNFVDA